jgi:UDP-N-acetylmuramoyl-L-alanyl-D-glutamate--2,6-diaminopimelate ligase
MTTEHTLRSVADVLRRLGLLEEVRAGEDLAVMDARAWVEGRAAAGDTVLTGVTQDSRSVAEGDLFLAWKGTTADGHDFVTAAARAGARAAVVERFVEGTDLPQLRVAHGRRAAAIVAHELFGRPGDRLRITAVTGTNGKTTVALLARHLLARAGTAAAMGTLGVLGPDGRPLPGSGGLTTPGPVELARTLADLASSGVTSVTLEASSHALEQRRLDGLAVDAACFTNLSRDHLDYHGTFDRYLAAKARLLDLLRCEDSGAVVNGNDPAWAGLPSVPGRLLVTRVEGEGNGALQPPGARRRLPDLRVSRVELTGTGSRFRVEWDGEEHEGRLPLLGAFNVENAATALGAALLAGLPLSDAAAGLADAPAPPGRLEIAVTRPVPVILDYAHTPDALRRALEALRPLYPGRLIVVFGAGGDRDAAKRPEMGRAAVEGADVVIVTSDNPRTEDPERIIDQIEAGMGGAPHRRLVDRREAMGAALDEARPGDAVLLAGKGHETYQEVGPERRPFDERAILGELLGDGGGA